MKIINFVYYIISILLVVLYTCLLGWAVAGVPLMAARVLDFWKINLLILSGMAAVFCSYWIAMLGSKFENTFARIKEDYKEFENYKFNQKLEQTKASVAHSTYSAQQVYMAAQRLKKAEENFAHIYDKNINALTQSRKKSREEREEIEVDFKEIRDTLDIPRNYFIAENTADKVIEEIQKKGGLNA